MGRPRNSTGVAEKGGRLVAEPCPGRAGNTLLSHAIALGEGRQNGETLKMQNIVRRLFSDKAWLGKVFEWLPADHRAMFFERFQASIAWDPSTHHAIVVRMTKIAPAKVGLMFILLLFPAQ